ncbi:MAG: ATP-binding protein [Pseudomonadota bacterium]
MELTAAQYREALEHTPDALVLVDQNGEVLFANRQVEAVFGYNASELVGKPVEMLIPARFHATHAGHRHSFQSQTHARPMGRGLELFGLHRDGREFQVEVSLSPMSTANGVLVAAAIRDVSERKRAEQLIVAARDTADRALLAKNRFIATASHDLRQPVQAIALLNHSLQRINADSSIADVLGQQAQAIETASRLLNALLDVSRLESGTVSTERRDVAVGPLLQKLANEFAPIAADKRIRLVTEACGARASTDPNLLEQLLRNLLSNAIKYTERGEVRLLTVEDPESLRIEVRDTGIGIAPERLRNIFDDFYQVVDAARTRQGYGLGLGIVQRLANLLGARVDVTSTVGEGSVFTVTVPRAVVKDQPTRESMHRPMRHAKDALKEGRSARVLLIDDDEVVRTAINMVLSLEGYDVIAASGSDDAVSRCVQTGRPDLILSDFDLGDGQSGEEVVERICGIFDSLIPVVFLTGDTAQVSSEARHRFSAEVMSKPVQPRELMSAVKRGVARGGSG